MIEAEVMAGYPSDAALTEQLLAPAYRPQGKGFWLLVALSLLGVFWLGVATVVTLVEGIGMWGNNIPVGWAFGIINFVFWIGIGHAGTFISAILLLLEQSWRTSINRFAEGMTLFAVIQASFFPLMHLGRPWFAYWLVPYPSTMDIWPQFRSALPWDAAAIATYFTVSLLFWYLGLIPDLAAMRDHAPGRTRRIIYGIFALGWRGSARQYRHYRLIYGLLAGLATPLVLSVHSIVSSDFASGIVPGWHSTIFPPFFVAGAIFSGFAMVITLTIPIRAAFKLHDFVTERHLDNMGKFLLVTGLIVALGYLSEAFMAWWSGDPYESHVMTDRITGAYAPVTWVVLACNVLVPQVLWSGRARRSVPLLFVAALLVNVGMWAERFVIVVQSLHCDFLPAAWRLYVPTFWDWATLIGSIGLFCTLMFLFVRFLPLISMSEMRALVHDQRKDRRPVQP
jgi:molybdopterin-containing oxidoreductase family membrane subunit